jgi:hypothetical protein
MPPVGFEPTTSAGERPQTYTLDGTTTGTGMNDDAQVKNIRSRSSPKAKKHIIFTFILKVGCDHIGVK